MCGIAGLLTCDANGVETALRAMVSAQTHRGPDDSGEEYFSIGRVHAGLGFRRLSILDLSPAGHQPMIDPKTGNALVFNGEIYNFRSLRRQLEGLGETFVSQGDSEVLLRALCLWDAAALPRLEGMFGLAFYEKRSGKLLLARDSSGIKPLYLARSGSSWLFASEVRAILASGLLPNKLSLAGMAGLLAYGAVQEPLTLFNDVLSVPAGTWQEIRPSGDGAKWETESPRRFWNYPAANGDMQSGEAVEIVRTTLTSAVGDHLVADVPVGVFLSSGLDSTVIASLAAQHTPDLRSFTVGFADEPDFSELQLAAETAKRLRLQHTEIKITGPEAEAAVLDWASCIDQPSVDGLNVFVISRAVRLQGIKVALSGLGGDELFCGYPSFREVPWLQSRLRWLRHLPASARRKLVSIAGFRKSSSFQAKLADMGGSDNSLLSLYLHRRRLLSNQQMAGLGLDASRLGLSPDFLPAQALAGLSSDETDSIALISRFESSLYQQNMLLRDADTNGMAQGLEIRVPMLDRRLVEQVHSMPGRTRLPPGRPDKYLLRQAFAPLLRSELLSQSKRGFTLPIQRWMANGLRPFCEEALATLKGTCVFKSQGIDAVWQAYLREPESPIWTRAWLLCVLGTFMRRTRAAF